MKILMNMALCLFFIYCSTVPEIRLVQIYHSNSSKEAMKKFLQEEKIYPNDWEINYYLGKCYFDINDLRKAKINFNTALQKNAQKEELIKKELIKVYKKAGDNFYNQAQFDSSAFYYHQVFFLYEK
jgi:tetratricopeptide (TPR) repeat protein